ncbi:MAG TPA: sulfite exporter TauE/SafE family protein [Gemmatimonadaceae bacterium]|nr:sulfite exporter TauE/SafE family protein [Gemmatimonadaceae bacterium]
MNEMAALIVTAVILGAQHTLAPDHVAAVSVFASQRPSWQRALGLGARWGVGHSLTIVLLGSALVLSGAHIPLAWESSIERLVGVALVLVGCASIWRAARSPRRWHEHDGVRHAHPPMVRGARHDRDHRALLGIGMLHGVAGTGALVIAIPLAAAGSPARSMMFLASFGIGTIVAMSVFAAAAGAVFGRAARRSAAMERGLGFAAGAGSVLVGVWWWAAAAGATP